MMVAATVVVAVAVATTVAFSSAVRESTWHARDVQTKLARKGLSGNVGVVMFSWTVAFIRLRVLGASGGGDMSDGTRGDGTNGGKGGDEGCGGVGDSGGDDGGEVGGGAGGGDGGADGGGGKGGESDALQTLLQHSESHEAGLPHSDPVHSAMPLP